MRRKKAEDAVAPSSGQSRITPTDVQQVEFRLAFRGYKERDVDAFLDRVTEDLASYIEENRRLREVEAAPAVSGTAGAAEREAERILTEARAEAARIIGEAEARAAVLGGSAGDARAAVAPFLTREREFLQDLGALVQGHAEEVKEMVHALRARAEEAAGEPPPATVPPAPPAEAPPATERAAEEQAPVPEPDVPTSPPADVPATSQEDAFAPITVPDAQDEEQGPEEEPAPAQLRRDSGERSLRELFWGED